MSDSNDVPELPDIDKLWDFSAPAESERKFRELLPRTTPLSERSYQLQLMTQIARAQGLQNQFQEAHATLNEVEGQIGPGLELPRIRLLLERGRVFNSAGEPGKAMPLFGAAYELAEQTGQMHYAIDAAHMVAIASPDPAERVEWNLKAIKMVEANPDQRGWLFALYNNLGEAYRALGEYDNALLMFQKLIASEKEAGREPWLYSYVDEAKMLRLTGRCEVALQSIRPLHETLQKQGKPDAFVTEELGEELLASGNKEEALPHLREAYAQLATMEWLAKSEPDRLERLKDLTEVQK